MTTAGRAAIAVITIVIVHALFTLGVGTVARQAHAATVATTCSSLSMGQTFSDDSTVDRGRFDVEQRGGKGTPDLYGNEVTEAIAEYKLDARGSLYELHSPQTEMPRLRPPTL